MNNIYIQIQTAALRIIRLLESKKALFYIFDSANLFFENSKKLFYYKS